MANYASASPIRNESGWFEPRASFKWRGLEIRTPYFAAADLPQLRKSGLIKPAPATKNSPKPEGLDVHGVFAALAFYGIAGWSSKWSDK
jgi:hypothetical protein